MDRIAAIAPTPSSTLMPLVGTASAFFALVAIGIVGGANAILAMM